MQIKEVLKKDLGKVIEVHKNSFEGFFLTELGDNFLNLYYNSVRKNKNGILLGFYEEGALFGFAAATTLSKGLKLHVLWAPIGPWFILLSLKLLK